VQLTLAHNQKYPHWIANLRIAPLIAVVFLCAQMLATAHDAAYASSDHLHDGTPCIISASCKHDDGVDLAGPAPTFEQAPQHLLVPKLIRISLHDISLNTDGIRGPPSVI